MRLAFASFLMLFVELALIRWITANNVYVTEATNFVLLASFLGIGIGFLNAASGRDYLRWTPVALLALVGFVLEFPVILHSGAGGPLIFSGVGQSRALPQPVSFGLVFLLTVAVMAGLGQGVARIFIRFRPLSAYRLDILGSIAGIALFSLLSFLDQPPVTWGVIACCGLVVVLAPKVRMWQILAVGAVVLLLTWQSVTPHQEWSPYNKLTLHKRHGNSVLFISANNIPYQGIHPLSAIRKNKQFYLLPYQHVSRASLGNVLIIGAGNGNDVAVALSEGARHVDAVEIDPLLVQIGRQYHPAHPYQSPRVTVHIDDGRQYLQDTQQRYNLILYALPDSLTALAGQSGIRLESYLLTTQALQAARAHLAPGGTFAMYNYYAPFVLNRYATTIQDAFGRDPCAQLGGFLQGRRMAVLTVRPAGPVPDCASFWHGTRVAPATDNRPFPYLASATIPPAYLWLLGAILLASLLLVRLAGRPAQPDAVLPGPGLHGRCLPAAGNQEHRAVRAVVRHHLVRERPGLRGRPGRRSTWPSRRQDGCGCRPARCCTWGSCVPSRWPGSCRRGHCSDCPSFPGSSRQAPWRSPRSTLPTSFSPSGSPGWKPRRRRSPPISSAQWSAARSSTSP